MKERGAEIVAVAGRIAQHEERDVYPLALHILLASMQATLNHNHDVVFRPVEPVEN